MIYVSSRWACPTGLALLNAFGEEAETVIQGAQDSRQIRNIAATKLGIDVNKLAAVEFGFEDHDGLMQHLNQKKYRKYFQIGQRLRRFVLDKS
jgi:hypothetical protein